MTGRERLLAAIAHQEPDRVPVAPRLWAWLLDYCGDASLPTYLRICEEFGGDVFWCEGAPTPSYIRAWPERYNLPEVRVEQRRRQDGPYTIVERRFYTPAGPLSDRMRMAPPRSYWGMSPDPVIEEPLVKTREDLERLSYLMPIPSSDMSGYHRADELVGDRGLTELYILGVLDQRAADARGMAQLMVDYYNDRAFFDAQIDLSHRQMMAETQAALEGGVEIIFGSWFYESLSVGWSPAIWREVFLPRLKQQVDLVHSAGAIYHIYDDGKMHGLLGMLAEAGVDVVSTCTPPPVGDFDLAAAKRDFGARLCFHGYVDLLYVVKLGTPELVERTVRDALDIAKPGGGLILGSSDSFREGTPLENVRAYFDAARKYGAY